MSDDHRATPQDLDQAQADVTLWDERWANDNSNNPNKYWSQRQAARRRVRVLTAMLELQGDLEMTDHERLCATLDAFVPNARSGQVVEHDGLRYRRRSTPKKRAAQARPSRPGAAPGEALGDRPA